MNTGLTTPICELDDNTLKHYHTAITRLDPSRPPSDTAALRTQLQESVTDRRIRDFDQLLAPALSCPENYSLLIAAIRHTLQCEIDRRTQARIVNAALRESLHTH